MSSALHPVPHDAAVAGLFAQQGYVVITGLLPAPRAAMVRDHLLQRAQAGTMTTDTSLGTPIPAIYGDALIDNLMNALLPAVSYCTGLALYPTYSYARIYKAGDKLPPHRARRACEISLSLKLGQQPDTPWALCVEDSQKKAAAATLGPGDALVYRGIELTHWREPYQGEQLVQTFLHYVDQNGPNAGQRFDGRSALGTPLAAS